MLVLTKLALLSKYENFAFSYSSLLFPNKNFFIAMQLSIFRFSQNNSFGFGLVVAFATLTLLVGSNGLGPSTSRLSGVCSNQLSYEPIYGGGNRVRTDDPLLAGQVLYQLSYTPITFYETFPPRKINAPPFQGKHLAIKNRIRKKCRNFR